MHVRGVAIVAAVVGACARAVQGTAIPFDVCVQSSDWQRPTAEVQAAIWNDPRYRESGPQAYQWNHEFFWSEPDSASLAYENMNLSGAWTEPKRSACQRRDGERSQWTETWVLGRSVEGIQLADRMYTVRVSEPGLGYEVVQFRRPASLGSEMARLRFVDSGGRVLDEWVETSPAMFAAAR